MRNCLNCNKDIVDPKHQKSRKYCSIPCQQAYQTQEKIDRWLEEGNWHWGSQMIGRWMREYIKERDNHTCTVCELSEWMGQPITLEVDHIDGDHANNNVDNLRSVCPNCHSQTDSFKGKNRGNGRTKRYARVAELV